MKQMFCLGRKSALIFVIGIQMMGLGVHAIPALSSTVSASGGQSLTLTQCLETALENNRTRRVSQAAVAIAEAQYQQAVSAFWPMIDVNILAHRMDEDPNYVFPEEHSTYTIQGLAPVPMQVQVTVPEKDIKLMDRDSVFGSIDLALPLYTGGKRRAVSKQARIGVDVAKAASRRTDLQVIYDVKKMYYGAVLATNLKTLAKQAFDRFQVTLDLTETLYKGGSGAVKKTDFLRSKVISSSLKALLVSLSSGEALARAALVNTMGLEWQNNVTPSEKAIPFEPIQGDLERLVAEAYRFNPDWETLQMAVTAAEAGIKKAHSGHFPVIALVGKLSHIENDYDKGHVTDENVNSWSLGLNLNLPIFHGFRTVAAVKEAKMQFEKRQHESVLFREGLAMMVKDALLQMARAQGEVEATREALDMAKENRELNVRAYKNELVDTKDVIEAQLMESFVNGRHARALYDHIVYRFKIDFLVGKQMKPLLDR